MALMAEWCSRLGVEIWAYCLMPNHVHLIAVPSTEDGLRRAIGEAHRRYTRYINYRKDWRGYLWQGRFASFIMDETHLLVSARYIEMNPVRAKLVKKPADYPWSSAAAHLTGKDDNLVKVAPLLGIVGNWKNFIATRDNEGELNSIRLHERTGRPHGNKNFVSKMELLLNRTLAPKKPGPQKL